MTAFMRILVAVDGTPTSNRGLATAIALAEDQNATLHVLHVIDDSAIVPMFEPAAYAPDYLDAMVATLRETGRKVLARAQALAAKSGLTIQQKVLEARGQGVAKAILQHARSVRADLIVMGTHGRRGVSRLVMGSDAEGVLREATVPMLLVRAPKAKAARKGAKRVSGKGAARNRKAANPIARPT